MPSTSLDTLLENQEEKEETMQNVQTLNSGVFLDEPLVNDNGVVASTQQQHRISPLYNFCIMAILFSANHGTIVSCLALATSRLGAVGAWQSGILYIFYTASAVFGGTYVVKKLGGRNGMISGMLLYCIYVSCFVVATTFPTLEKSAALTGAAFGGLGAGFLWIAQGNYFSEAAKHHAMQGGVGVGVDGDTNKSSSYFAGIFAFIYLFLEVLIRSLSSALVSIGIDWRAIFAIYTAIACASTFGMIFVIDYPKEDADGTDADNSFLKKATAALQLLVRDSKMKYMIGINATFGFAGAFLNSYINGEVVGAALNDKKSQYVGVLSSWTALTAAFASLLTSKFSSPEAKGNILITGAVSFFFVAFPFLIFPDATSMWNIYGLLLIYTFQGIGRASFESTLKATFAEYFANNSTGAFGNIILQNGLASAIGYILSFQLRCNEPSRYCVEYSDGTLHNVLIFEVIVCGTAVLGIVGYCYASKIFKKENSQAVLDDA